MRGKLVRCDSQTALLLVVLVVPTLHIVRDGIDENIAFLLLGFGIVLSDDRMEVVQIVTFYTWLVEGTWGYSLTRPTPLLERSCENLSKSGNVSCMTHLFVLLFRHVVSQCATSVL